MEFIYGIVIVVLAVGLIVSAIEWRRGKPFEAKGNSATTDPFMTGEGERANDAVSVHRTGISDQKKD